jgi:hypothetical protein
MSKVISRIRIGDIKSGVESFTPLRLLAATNAARAADDPATPLSFHHECKFRECGVIPEAAWQPRVLRLRLSTS